jgi:hypothetical protein
MGDHGGDEEDGGEVSDGNEKNNKVCSPHVSRVPLVFF